VFPSTGLCVALITRPEEAYPLLSSANINLYTYDKLGEEVKQTNKF